MWRGTPGHRCGAVSGGGRWRMRRSRRGTGTTSTVGAGAAINNENYVITHRCTTKPCKAHASNVWLRD
eukprot:3307320-Pleurochrysis_carterae.AAC.2